MSRELVPVASQGEVQEAQERMDALEDGVLALTTQLNEWRGLVEGSLKNTEGQKVDLAAWAGSVNDALKHLDGSAATSHQEIISHDGRLSSTEALLDEQAKAIQDEGTARQRSREELMGLITAANSSIANAQTTMLSLLNQETSKINDHVATSIEGKLAVLQVQTTDARVTESALMREEIRGVRDHASKDLDRASEAARLELAATKLEWRTMLDDAATQIRNACLETIETAKQELTALVTAHTTAIPPPYEEEPHTTPLVIHPPASGSGGHAPISSILKWTRQLEKMVYPEVRTFDRQFRQYISAANVDEDTAKALLFQSSFGRALRFMESLPSSLKWKEVLDRLLERVRPSNSSVLRALLECKQRASESMVDYMVRYHGVAEGYPNALINSSELRQMMVDNLSETWRGTARSIVQAEPEITVEDLFRRLIDIQGPTAAMDPMQVDAVADAGRFIAALAELDEARLDIGQVIANGGINWSEVRDERSLLMAWRQMMRTKPQAREECLRWLHNKPAGQSGRGQPYQQRGGGPRGSQQPRGSRGIFHADGPAQPWEAPPDDAFDEAEDCIHANHVTVKPSSSVRVLHHSSHSVSQPSPPAVQSTQPRVIAANTMRYSRNPLMYVNAKLNGVGFQPLVDTGAALSILPINKAQKLGVAIDVSRKVQLQAFDGSTSTSLGTAVLSVYLGDTQFEHPFCVVPTPDSKLIFGNDMWAARSVMIDPANISCA